VDDRAVSPVVGAVMIVAIVVVLAGVVASGVLSLSGEQSAPHAVLTLAADTDDDQIRLTHDGGDTLSADRTRIVWEVGGTTVRSDATSTEQDLLAGGTATFTFDGTTSAEGVWSSYASPGDVDITASDTLTIALYDTASGKPIIEETTTARAVQTDFDAGSGSGLIFAHDTSPGAQTTHEINWGIGAGDDAEGSSLNNVEIRYPSGVDFPDVDSRSDVTAAGIDEDGDGTVDDAATVECCPSDSDGDGDVDGDGVYQGYSGDPDTLRIEFQGNADIDAGERMIVRIQDVDNPSSAGSYTVVVGIDGAQTESGTLEID